MRPPKSQSHLVRPGRIDHLVYACSDLQKGIERISTLLGVVPVMGGHHPNWGKHNALVGLGSDCYLEVIAPVQRTASDDVRTPDVFAGSDTGRLTTWAAGVNNLEGSADSLLGLDPPLGSLIRGSRRQANGQMLSWVLTDPSTSILEGTVPFLIDWGDSDHPAGSLDSPCSLLSLQLAHPRLDAVESQLSALGLLDLVELQQAEQPTLSAIVETPQGRVGI